MATERKPEHLYPHFAIELNKKPNRLYAFPIVGIIIKLIMLIPVFIESFFLGIAFLFCWIVNSFVIVFSGYYWDTAYNFFLGLMRFSTKVYAFILGLTDQYPGFNLKTNGLFELHIEKPKHPNRWFAIPVIGLLIRFILLIPYHIFSHIMQNGSWVAMIASWFKISFHGKFPESLHEFEHDTIRIGLSSVSYITGLSDTYPSFHISMNHQTVKLLLLIVGTFLLLWNGFRYSFVTNNSPRPYRYHYQNRFNRMRQQYNYNNRPMQRPMNNAR